MSARRSRTRSAAAGPARRPRRPARHRLLRPVLGAALIVAGIVTPIGFEDVPAPLHGVAGEGTAHAQDQDAQSAIMHGTPDRCPQDPVPYKPSSLDGGQERRLVHPGTGDDPNDFPLCGLETPACPKDPTIDEATVTDDTAQTADLFLRPSMQLPGGGTDSQGNPLYLRDSDSNPVYRYPGFCEERYFRSPSVPLTDSGGNPGGNPVPAPAASDDVAYEACARATGFVRMIHVMPVRDAAGDRLYYDGDGDPDTDDPVLITQSMCRLIHPPVCVAGLHRVGSNTCRAVVRRTWRCPDGYVPRNEFNTCYKEPEMAGDTPACLDGRPEFVAQHCRDYVGEDYERNPHTVDCAAIDVGKSLKNLAEKESGPANPYWCQFASRYLNVECHKSQPDGSCTDRPLAYCLKRASKTGGCHAIAHTLNCRALQAAFEKGSATAQQVRNEGCQPCILLPFEPPPSDSNACPTDLTEDPRPPSGGNPRYYEALWRERRNLAFFYLDCDSEINTEQPLDPGSDCDLGNTCPGPSLGVLEWSSGHHSGLAIVNSPVVLRVEDVPAARHERIYPTSRGGVLLAKRPESFLAFDDIGDVSTDDLGTALRIRVWPQLDAQTSYTRQVANAFIDDGSGGGCIFSNRPQFRIIVQELWPDIPKSRERIAELFGEDSLAWWDGLDPSLRETYTEARDFVYWDDTQSFGTQDERKAALDRALRERSMDPEEVTCNVGDTIWCRWYPTRSGYYELRGASASEVRYFSGPPRWKSGYLETVLRRYLADPDNKTNTESVLGIAGLTAEEAGINVGLTAPLAIGSDSEMLLTEAVGLLAQCPAIDQRIECRNTEPSGIYEETAPIGIQVHEIRVATRAPNTQ